MESFLFFFVMLIGICFILVGIIYFMLFGWWVLLVSVMKLEVGSG